MPAGMAGSYGRVIASRAWTLGSSTSRRRDRKALVNLCVRHRGHLKLVADLIVSGDRHLRNLQF